jgi:NAD+ diphosphatase
MLGFHALADPADAITVQPTEIADARWFTRAQIRLAVAGDVAAGFGLPMESSIAHYLITAWLDQPAT